MRKKKDTKKIKKNALKKIAPGGSTKGESRPDLKRVAEDFCDNLGNFK